MRGRRCSISSQASFVDIPSNWKVRISANNDDLAAEATYLIETLSCDLAAREEKKPVAAVEADGAESDSAAARTAGPRKLHLALSGGSTPKRIYESFAKTYFFKQVLDRKAELNLWYGDVRRVPNEHADSNARMVMTAPRPTSLPVPAVVGTAYIGGSVSKIFAPPFSRTEYWASGGG